MEERRAKQSTLLGDNRNACTFCRFINREVESYVVFEDRDSFAFLDDRPLFPGHVLLVPKVHYGNINDMPERVIGVMFGNVKALSNALEKGLGAEGCFIAINNKVSQSEPHLHVHIVPRRFKDGLKGFFWPRYKYSSDKEKLEVQEKIVNALTGK